MGLAAMILGIERIDCDVNQVQEDLADVTVPIWILHNKAKGEIRKWLLRRVRFRSILLVSSAFLWDKKEKYREAKT